MGGRYSEFFRCTYSYTITGELIKKDYYERPFGYKAKVKDLSEPLLKYNPKAEASYYSSLAESLDLKVGDTPKVLFALIDIFLNLGFHYLKEDEENG
ncbi:MAG: hypothetical protein Q9M91_05270 [Candidatus Dojkabacteria bacterium]|nr:hypothetical protein [Candidatus Dojkabacteria bacterium]